MWKTHGVVKTAEMLASTVETIDKAASTVGLARRETFDKIADAIERLAPPRLAMAMIDDDGTGPRCTWCRAAVGNDAAAWIREHARCDAADLADTQVRIAAMLRLRAGGESSG